MPDNELCLQHSKEIAEIKADTNDLKVNLAEVKQGTIAIRDALLGTMEREGHLSKNARVHAEHWLWIKGIAWITGIILIALIGAWIVAL